MAVLYAQYEVLKDEAEAVEKAEEAEAARAELQLNHAASGTGAVSYGLGGPYTPADNTKSACSGSGSDQ